MVTIDNSIYDWWNRSMWITEDVDLPPKLQDALERGKLVIFAGAGVSMSAPSSMPSFDRLTAQVAEESGSVFVRREDEGNDHFLGRLKKRGVDIHKIVHKLISNPNSYPNEIHRLLASLYLCGDRVRIITTNFDPHFSTVCEQQFSRKIRTYMGPALPVGNDFSGLVYLHGSIYEDSNRLVLTDEDFGRAYLTNGWASRFLQEMFREFTVLFVGYSHNDPIVTYLARGLPPGTERYAFGAAGDDEHWRFLDVQFIPYPVINHDHHALVDALRAWGDFVKMTHKEHQTRTLALVTEGPAKLSAVQSDYLVWALNDPYAVEYFVREAKSAEWLRWVEAQGLLDSLFDRNMDWSQALHSLGWWVVDQFVLGNSDEGLSLLERHHQRLRHELWDIVAGALAERAPLPDPTVFAHWISVLLASPDLDVYSPYLATIVEKCRPDEDTLAALAVFEYLTTPRLKLTENVFKALYEGSEPVLADIELAPPNDGFQLRNLWDTALKPNLAYYAPKLAQILTRQIEKAHDILCSIQKATQHFDINSWTTRTLDPVNVHDHDYYDPFRVVIDGARDVLMYMLETNNTRAHILIQTWAESGVPLLQRLAIFGERDNSTETPAEKVEWLIGHKWLHVFRNEVMPLLQSVFPHINEDLKKRLVTELEATADELAIDQKNRDYSVYNALHWFHVFDPEHVLIHRRLQHYQQQYPEFTSSKYSGEGIHFTDMPDLDARSLWNSEALLALPPKVVQSVFREQDGTKLQEFLNTVRVASQQSFDWSWAVVEQLSRKELLADALLFEAILKGWSEAVQFTEQQWESLISLLVDTRMVEKFRRVIPDVLLCCLERSKVEVSKCLETLETITTQLFKIVLENDDSEEAPLSEDELKNAPFSLVGQVVRVGLGVVVRCFKSQKFSRLPEPYREAFVGIIRGKTKQRDLARVILMSRLQTLYAVDQEWTTTNVLPLLEWSGEPKGARTAWYGHLHRWNQISYELLEELQPYYVKAFDHLSDFDFMRKPFVEEIAKICCHGRVNPLTDFWLRKFIIRASEVDRLNWVTRVHQELRRMSEPRRLALWSEWIQPYWNQRIEGLPIGLGMGESAKMMNLMDIFSPVLHEFLACMCQSPVPAGDLTNVYLTLRQYVDSHPEWVAKVLCHLLPMATRTTSHLMGLHVRDIYGHIRDIRGLAEEAEFVENQLIRLGYY